MAIKVIASLNPPPGRRQLAHSLLPLPPTPYSKHCHSAVLSNIYHNLKKITFVIYHKRIHIRNLTNGTWKGQEKLWSDVNINRWVRNCLVKNYMCAFIYFHYNCSSINIWTTVIALLVIIFVWVEFNHYSAGVSWRDSIIEIESAQ